MSLIKEDIVSYKKGKAKEEALKAALENYNIMTSDIESARQLDKIYKENRKVKLALERMLNDIVRFNTSDIIYISSALGSYEIENTIRRALHIKHHLKLPITGEYSLIEAVGWRISRGEFDHINEDILKYLHECANMARPYDNYTSIAFERARGITEIIKSKKECYLEEQHKSYLELKNKSLLEFNIEIRKYLRILSRKRKSLQFKDEYGFINNKAWEKEKNNFLEKFHLPTFWDFHYIEDASILIDSEVDNYQKDESDELGVSFSDAMSPYEYEGFCSSIMISKGWDSNVTKGSGDQGVDIIAVKYGVSVAIQCKMYNQPVGNSAVQEVFSGKEYYDSSLCAVVTNNTYTPSARRLAAKLNVILIHHDDLHLSDDIFLFNNQKMAGH